MSVSGVSADCSGICCQSRPSARRALSLCRNATEAAIQSANANGRFVRIWVIAARVSLAGGHERVHEDSAGHCLLFGLLNMCRDMMPVLVGENEGDLVIVPRVHKHRDRKSDDRCAICCAGLVCIPDWHLRIHHNPDIAVVVGTAFGHLLTAEFLGYGFGLRDDRS
jgi:hypothetical protein